MHDVAIGHDIVLALNTQLAGSLGALLATELDVVVVANDLGLNKAALKVGVERLSMKVLLLQPFVKL